MYNITNKRLMLTVYYKKREELASTVEAHFSGRGWNTRSWQKVRLL